MSCPRHSVQAVARSVPQPGDLPEGHALIGTVLGGQYEVHAIIGKGAMGIVYKAVSIKDGKEVAIKVLHTHLAADPESIKRFHHEAKAASSLMHANIVRIFEVGVAEGGQPYIVMELLDGVTLSQFLKQRQRLTTREALPIIRQICEALAEAHSRGVLHRDIKPANIMLCNRFGVENFVLVLDFSIAKIIQRVSDVDSTTPGLIFGSPTYMSPERFMGRGGDFRSDIYSTGIIMFQLLAGRPPFKSSDLYTLMNEHIGAAPPTVKEMRHDNDVPEILEEAIARALAKKPENRQENMKQLLADVNEVYRQLRAPKDEPVQEPAMIGSGFDSAHGRATIGASATPESPFNAFANASGLRSNEKQVNYGFEIDPGVADTGLTPGNSMPVYQNASRKSQTQNQEESLRQKLPQDHGTSGRWDKTKTPKQNVITTELIATSQRQRIRPKEPETQIPVELIALLAVILIGLGTICFSQFMTPKTVAPQHTVGASPHMSP